MRGIGSSDEVTTSLSAHRRGQFIHCPLPGQEKFVLPYIEPRGIVARGGRPSDKSELHEWSTRNSDSPAARGAGDVRVRDRSVDSGAQ